jgi:hypothetical protein
MRNQLLLYCKASLLAFPRPLELRRGVVPCPFSLVPFVPLGNAALVDVRKVRFAPLLTGIKNTPQLRFKKPMLAGRFSIVHTQL